MQFNPYKPSVLFVRPYDRANGADPDQASSGQGLHCWLAVCSIKIDPAKGLKQKWTSPINTSENRWFGLNALNQGTSFVFVVHML